jgi:hypothetical protein
MKRWRIEEVETEIPRRARNEWIEQTSDRFDDDHVGETYVCECGDRNCSERVSLTRAEYETVRASGAHFVVAIDHEDPGIERVLSENLHFTIVEKLLAEGRMSQTKDSRR